MALSSSFRAFVAEQLAPLGPVEILPMFGGAAVRLGGQTFGLIDDDILYLKVDAANRPAFDAEGMEPFTYPSKNGPMTMSGYRRAPERLFDEADELVAWARAAVGVANRAAAKKPKPKAVKPRGRKT
jgi:DNA transformation protein and related proteins